MVPGKAFFITIQKFPCRRKLIEADQEEDVRKNPLRGFLSRIFLPEQRQCLLPFTADQLERRKHVLPRCIRACFRITRKQCFRLAEVAGLNQGPAEFLGDQRISGRKFQGFSEMPEPGVGHHGFVVVEQERQREAELRRIGILSQSLRRFQAQELSADIKRIGNGEPFFCRLEFLEETGFFLQCFLRQKKGIQLFPVCLLYGLFHPELRQKALSVRRFPECGGEGGVFSGIIQRKRGGTQTEKKGKGQQNKMASLHYRAPV